MATQTQIAIRSAKAAEKLAEAMEKTREHNERIEAKLDAVLAELTSSKPAAQPKPVK